MIITTHNTLLLEIEVLENQAPDLWESEAQQAYYSKFMERKADLQTCYKIAIKFEGLKRHTSIHAAGVVMSSVDLDEVIPLDKSHDFYLSGYDMTYLEENKNRNIIIVGGTGLYLKAGLFDYRFNEEEVNETLELE